MHHYRFSNELRPLRILLADDSPDNRLIVQGVPVAKDSHFSIDEAENGESGVVAKVKVSKTTT